MKPRVGKFSGSMYFWALTMSGDMTSTNLTGYHFQAVVTSETAARKIEEIFAGGGWVRYKVSYRATLHDQGSAYVAITKIVMDEPHLDGSLPEFDIASLAVIMRDIEQIKEYIKIAVRDHGDDIQQDIGTGNLPYVEPPRVQTNWSDDLDEDL